MADMKVGSVANAPENSFYTDLVLTRYPEFFDERTGAKINNNLVRQTNLQDYNMAEHVNALQDAVMAVQRVLGEMVQMPAKPVDANGEPITDPTALRNLAMINTVKDRLNAIELFDWYGVLDKRYGGPTWAFDENAVKNATIQEHRHLGFDSSVPGSPEKISLTEEVTGLLQVINLNLAKATGLTGANIYVQPDSPKKLSEALDSVISEETGGTISKTATLEVLGKTNTRWTREFDATDALGSLQQDGKTLLNQAMESPATAASTMLQKKLSGMYHGRYVAIVRLSTTSLAATPMIEIVAQNSTNNSVINSAQLTGADFDSVGNYKTFFLVFDHEGATNLIVRKLNTVASTKVRFDYAIVEPVHPAVFDR